MDEFEYSQVTSFFHKLVNRPLAEVIRLIPSEISLTPNFSMIQDKLDKNKYISIADFAIDVRTLFTRAIMAVGSDQISVLAISDLEIWFEKHLVKIPRNREELAYNQLNNLKKECDDMRRAMSLSAARIKTYSKGISMEEQKRPAPPSMISEVQKLLTEEMRTAEIQMNVAAIMKKHIPTFEPLPEMRIDASQIDYELAQELKDYLSMLKKERLEKEEEE